jgi:hypothetical protein
MAEIHIHHKPKRTKALVKPSSKVLKFLVAFLLDMLPIILGILIAVGINNWNEKRKDHEQERFYLSNIESSLHESIKSLQEGKSLYEDVLFSQKYILKYYRGSHLDKDSMYPNITVFLVDVYPDLPNIGFRTLQNTGKLDILSNKEILSGLISLYEFQLPKLQRLVELYLDYKRNQLIPLINSNFLIASFESKKLLDQIQFRNIMMQLPLANIISGYDELLDTHKKLLSKICSELKNSD